MKNIICCFAPVNLSGLAQSFLDDSQEFANTDGFLKDRIWPLLLTSTLMPLKWKRQYKTILEAKRAYGSYERQF